MFVQMRLVGGQNKAALDTWKSGGLSLAHEKGLFGDMHIRLTVLQLHVIVSQNSAIVQYKELMKNIVKQFPGVFREYAGSTIMHKGTRTPCRSKGCSHERLISVSAPASHCRHRSFSYNDSALSAHTACLVGHSQFCLLTRQAVRWSGGNYKTLCLLSVLVQRCKQVLASGRLW
jgi:hypothetical protein